MKAVKRYERITNVCYLQYSLKLRFQFLIPFYAVVLRVGFPVGLDLVNLQRVLLLKGYRG